MNNFKSLLFIFLFILLGLSNSYSDINSNTINCGGQEIEKNFTNLSQCSFNEILDNCKINRDPFDPLYTPLNLWNDHKAAVSEIFHPLVIRERTRGEIILNIDNGYCGFPEKLFNEYYEVIYTYLEDEEKEEKIKNSDSLIVSFTNPSQELSNTILAYFKSDFHLYDTSPNEHKLAILRSYNIDNIHRNTYPFFWYSRGEFSDLNPDYTIGLYIENTSRGDVRFIEIHYFKDGNFGQQFARDYDLYIEELIEYNDPDNNQNTGVL